MRNGMNGHARDGGTNGGGKRQGPPEPMSLFAYLGRKPRRPATPRAASRGLEVPELEPAPAPVDKGAVPMTVAPAVRVLDWERPPGDATPALPPSPPSAPAPQPTPPLAFPSAPQLPESAPEMRQAAPPAPETPANGPAEPADASARESSRRAPPVIQAGTFRVKDAGTLPDDEELARDIAAINDPTTEQRQRSAREQAVQGFLRALSQDPAIARPVRDQPEELRPVDGVDLVDMVADVAEVQEDGTASGGRVAVTSPPTPRATGVVEGIGLGVAIFEAGRSIATSGRLEVESAPVTYRHEWTPLDTPAHKYEGDFSVVAHHPRLFIDDQTFWFHLTFVHNGFDVRDCTVNLLVDKSSEVIASTFEMKFVPTELSARSEQVCKVRFAISGRWDPVGRGDVSFRGRLDVEATGRAELEITSELNWVRAGRFEKESRIALPVPPRVTSFKEVFFSPAGSSALDDASVRTVREWYLGLPDQVRIQVSRGALPVVLTGHASTTGSVVANQDLARKRAEGVQKIVRDLAGSDVVFRVVVKGELEAGTKDETEDPQQRRARLEVSYVMP